MNEPPLKQDPYTEELFKKIKEQNITVDPVIWELLNHVLGNRLYSIVITLGDFLSNPRWILNTGSYLMIFLYKVTGNKGKMYTIQESLGRAMKNTSLMKDFLNRLRETTKQKVGF